MKEQISHHFRKLSFVGFICCLLLAALSYRYLSVFEPGSVAYILIWISFVFFSMGLLIIFVSQLVRWLR